MATDYGVTSGHELYSTHRFRDDVKHMIIFDTIDDNSPLHGGHNRTRLYLTDDEYEDKLKEEELGEIEIIYYASVINGYLVQKKKQKRRKSR